ncbi:MAG: FAD-binding oxidoreductase [Candidatus Jordarchaeaceae archaeon]
MAATEKAYRELEDVLGADYVSNQDFVRQAYSRNVDPALPDRWPDIVVRPGSTEEVSHIVRVANKYKIPMVPRGGGADLVGGSKPIVEGGIVIDLTRMNRIVELNEDVGNVVVECGITWGELIEFLHKRGYTTGVEGPGSGMSATIGGGLSNNTIGFGSTKYGPCSENCIGVEVVLPNPDGDVIVTGSGASQYVKRPFSRWGMGPDFTGLFMGDVGTMGIKTKAVLKIYPLPEYREGFTFTVPEDYEFVVKVTHALQRRCSWGVSDITLTPSAVVMLYSLTDVIKPWKDMLLMKPVMMVGIEADDERMFELASDIVHEEFAKPGVTELGPTLKEGNIAEWVGRKQGQWQYFHGVFGVLPGHFSCTTCHKVPLNQMPEVFRTSDEHTLQKLDDYSRANVASVTAAVVYMMPRGECVIVGGMSGWNKPEMRETNLKLWKERLRFQVKYGGVHYWLGEVISQAIMEANAFPPKFTKFFKDIKRTLDPNFLLSPGKFHFYSAEEE